MKVRKTPKVTFIVVLQTERNTIIKYPTVRLRSLQDRTVTIARSYSFSVSLRDSPLIHQELNNFMSEKMREVGQTIADHGGPDAHVSIASVVRL